MLTQARVRELYNFDGAHLLRSSNRNGQLKGTEPGFLATGGYKQISVDGNIYMYHHIVWLWETGSLPELELDHIDQDKTNNSISNLRECNATINCQNRPLRLDNKSGTNGVYSHRNKWKAMIRVNKKLIHLGVFDTKELAIKAREKADIKYGFHKNHGKEI